MTRPVPRNPLVEGLLQPQAYPEAPQAVELVETHISYLFLTGQHVYKVKKPVDFGFLDFTSLEKRHHYCQREVELNRRLSPDVYLGVVEIRKDGGRYSVQGSGETVEYAVKMRQLPRHRAMGELLLRKELTPQMVHRVAARIAAFHRRAATSQEIARLGGYPAVCHNVQENFAQTEQYIGRTITRDAYDELRAYSEAFLEARQPLFERRAREGWIRDCHGDLHSVQIFLEDGIPIIDCIEFNERFRYSDVAADIAFLAMDLDYHRRPDLSRLLVEAYQQELADPGLFAFLDFYKVYRAYVRGKVEGFRLEDPYMPQEAKDRATDTARGYFRLALSYLQPLKRATLFVTVGLMGTGKTQVAQELSRRWGLPCISSDRVRKELAGIPATQHRYEPFDQGIYSGDFSLRTYREMLRQARELLKGGRSVILDGSFRQASLRGEALCVAQEEGVDIRFIECVAPEEAVRERLERRRLEPGAVSNGRWEIYQQQREAFEPLREAAPQAHLVLDTSGPEGETAFRLLKGLYITMITQEGEDG